MKVAERLYVRCMRCAYACVVMRVCMSPVAQPARSFQWPCAFGGGEEMMAPLADSECCGQWLLCIPPTMACHMTQRDSPTGRW